MSGLVHLDVHVQLHNWFSYGPSTVFRIQAYDASPDPVYSLPIALNCPTDQCDYWLPADVNTAALMTDGWKEFRFSLKVPTVANGAEFLQSSRWAAYVANGAPVSNYSNAGRLGAAGWYTGVGYSNVFVDRESVQPLLDGPINGPVQVRVKSDTPVLFCSLDPHMHATPPEIGNVLYDGAGDNGWHTVTIDPAGLAPGLHKLFVRGDRPGSSPEGVGSGVFVLAFEVGVDTTPPQVTQTSPVEGAAGVGLSTNVTATFSEDVQGVDGTTFTLTPEGGSAITASVSYSASSHLATLDPAVDLSPSTLYTATLTGGAGAIRDLAGNPLSPSPTTFSFTTGSGTTATIALVGSPSSASIAGGAALSLPSWTPGANELLLLEVATRDETRPLSVSGNGLTWTQLANVDNVQGQGGVAVFYAQGASPAAGQITVTVSGNTLPVVAIAQRFSGVDAAMPIEAVATNAGPAVDSRDMLQTVMTQTAGAWTVGLGWHRKALFSPPAGESGVSINQVGGSGADVTRGSMWFEGPVSSVGSVQVGATNDLSRANDWSLVVVFLRPGA